MNTSHTTEPDWALLGRYLADEATAEERELVQAWVHAVPVNAALLAELEHLWRLSAGLGTRSDSATQWQRLQARLRPRAQASASSSDRSRDAGGRTAGPTRTLSQPPRWRRRTAVASLLVVAGFSAWLIHRVGSDGPAPGTIHAAVHETGRGVQRRLVLHDGTHILLHVDSRLQVLRGDAVREVMLEGAAYFEVAVDPGRPFIVRVPGAVAEVLGTEFGLRAYAADGEVELVVAAGRVAFGSSMDANAQRVVRDQERARIRPDVPTVSIEPVSTDERLAWVRGQLVFRDTPAADVLRELARWYDYEFDAEPEIARRPLTATFDVMTESLGDVLGVIALSLDATYVVTPGRTIVFRTRTPRARTDNPSERS
jgi:transmembrane sensor